MFLLSLLENNIYEIIFRHLYKRRAQVMLELNETAYATAFA